MSNFSEISATADMITTQQSYEEETSHFRRRTLSNRRSVCPRRYVMAFLLSLVLVIEEARDLSLKISLLDPIMLNENRKQTEYPSKGSWTLTEYQSFLRFIPVGGVIMNVVGGILIHQFSSHKFLLITVAASSILHVLLPTALNHHSTGFLLFVLIGQEALSAPIFVAVLSMWKDWAPPDERTWLVSISFFGIALEAVRALIALMFHLEGNKSLSYYVGISGLIWTLIWYNIASSTPQSDPLITEKEYIYLESKIPSDYQEKIRIRDVPWKSIYKCKQIAILCVVFWKLGSSILAIQVKGLIFVSYPEDFFDALALIIPFVILFISLFYVSSFFMDFILRKNRNKALMIRKTFLCVGLFLHGVFSLGSIGASTVFIRAVLYVVAYCCLACSIAGVLRYPLDLSPRYVSIIAGFAFSAFCVGTLSFQEFTYYILCSDRLQPDVSVSIFDSIFSLLTAVIFGVWGDTEEQTWSYLTSSQRR